MYGRVNAKADWSGAITYAQMRHQTIADGTVAETMASFEMQHAESNSVRNDLTVDDERRTDNHLLFPVRTIRTPSSPHTRAASGHVQTDTTHRTPHANQLASRCSRQRSMAQTPVRYDRLRIGIPVASLQHRPALCRFHRGSTHTCRHRAADTPLLPLSMQLCFLLLLVLWPLVSPTPGSKCTR